MTVPALYDVRPGVAEAVAAGAPVVALESTVIAHGLPRPRNLETALRLEALVREAGAVPATIGVMAGRVVVGLSTTEVEALADADAVTKVSRRDLAAVVAGGAMGATTVAATMIAAAAAGIAVFATGGIGGVHRGGEASLDVSADLAELARTPVAVVCAGAKAILDVPRTLEVLETQGVPVVGFGTDRFPAFYVRDSGLAVAARVDSADAAAAVIAAHRRLGLGGGLVIANPPPAAQAMAASEVEALIAAALAAADAAGVHGKDVTPFLLDQLARASNGRTLETNIALLEDNARLGARIAIALAALG